MQAKLKGKSFLFALLVTVLLLALPLMVLAGSSGAAKSDRPAGQANGFEVIYAEKSALSAPLRDLVAAAPAAAPAGDQEMFLGQSPLHPFEAGSPDPVVQTELGDGDIPAPIQNWEGLDNIGGYYPPDTVGDVGPNHYVQMTNVYSAIYNKTGTMLMGPFASNVLWAGFGGPCENDNSGDPIVVYDPLADRWVLTQFAVSTGSHECFAVSQTADPTGAYHLYAFNIGGFPDYPKVSVWHDAYLATYRNFGGTFDMQASAVNRAKMLVGDPSAELILASITSAMPVAVDGFLPVDLDGTSTPPDAPGMFVGKIDGFSDPDDDRLAMFEMDIDWANIGNTTFTGPTYFEVAPFSSALGGIPQPDTAQALDSISFATMFRAAYRDFGFYQAMVLSHSVDVDGNDHAGVRWYELRNSVAGWDVYQQGTYAPDAENRWMPSIAMDQAGNIGVGFSVSSESTYPSIRYAGRLVSDPLGQMSQGEGTIIAGSGSQTGPAGRWGDYAAMSVDPVDECTFWFTTEYVETTGNVSWQTRIASFKFAECPDAENDFALWAQPDAQAVCAPDDTAFDISVFQQGAFNSPVTLNASGVPAGYTAGFAGNPVTPPDASVMSINNTGAATEGSYTITIEGSGGGSSHSVDVDLDIATAAPTGAVLSSPPDGAGNQSIRPILEWQAAIAGVSYMVEVATDAAFTNVVDSGVTTDPFYQVQTSLDTGETYYWRVKATNLCGEGTWSDPWTFSTLRVECPANTTTTSVYREEFDAGAAGWTHYADTGADTWNLTNSRPSPGSGGDAFMAQDPSVPGDQSLVSPEITLPADFTQITVQFYNEQDFEDPAGSPGGCWDGSIIEISTDGGGSWTQLDAELITDPYDGIGDNGPPAGVHMWCGETAGFQSWINSVADISAFGDQDVTFRFRMLSDAAAGAPGWWVDDVEVVACTDEVTDVSLTGLDAESSQTLWPLALLAAVIGILMIGIVRRVRTET